MGWQPVVVKGNECPYCSNNVPLKEANHVFKDQLTSQYISIPRDMWNKIQSLIKEQNND